MEVETKKINAFDLTEEQLKAQIVYELKGNVSQTMLIFILASLQEVQNDNK